jgi:hypothetical protein
MAISMYQASVPVFIRTLGNLREVLQKGASHAEARKFDPGILVASRLYPDMFPLSRQVQIACDMVKGGAARLAGVEPPKYEDNETTLPELLARIDKTVEYLKTLKAQQIDGSEERPVTLTTQRGTLNFTGQNYLLNFVLPNLYFHATTAYALLRHNGVELGKGDFLGKL